MTEQDERQALFDISLNHIRAQGEPSMDEQGCVFRNAEGLGCAAAPFITNYEPEVEEISIYGGCDVEKYFDPLAVKHSELVAMLQLAHDGVCEHIDFLGAYEYQMEKLAKKHSLSYTPPDAAGVAE